MPTMRYRKANNFDFILISYLKLTSSEFEKARTNLNFTPEERNKVWRIIVWYLFYHLFFVYFATSLSICRISSHATNTFRINNCSIHRAIIVTNILFSVLWLLKMSTKLKSCFFWGPWNGLILLYLGRYEGIRSMAPWTMLILTQAFFREVRERARYSFWE